tara:strand:+ start:178 stop:591 length:414 start_codon:yes stop_codon:yes gene_type:complete
MPDFSLGFGSLYGRFVKDEKQPERRTSGGSQSGSQAFSDRDPTPKPIGGPLTGLGEAATSTAMGLGNFVSGLYEGGRQVSGDVQDISGKTQEAAGKFFGAITEAPETVVGGFTKPVGDLTKDVLPLAAIAAAVLLLR